MVSWKQTWRLGQGSRKSKGDFLEASLSVASFVGSLSHANEVTHSWGGGAHGLLRRVGGWFIQ